MAMSLWDTLEQELKKNCPGMKVCRDEPMAKHTTFRIGGPAAIMLFPKTEAEAVSALNTLREMEITPFFLGNGSNLLVSDAGYDGAVVKYSPDLRPQLRNGELVAGGAILLSELSNAAAKLGLTGLEWAAGIPGTVGGAVTMNAGAYGGEMAQVVSWAKVMDAAGNVETIPGKKCGFSYRHSAFSDGRRLILEAGFALAPGNEETIRARMAELTAQRKAKQPLEFPSAGSTFKRPSPVDGQPVYAAELIDRCGCKGLRVGGAMVSEKHAGFIVNTGGATCADVLALMEEVKQQVFTQTGVELEPEVKILGV